MTDVLTSIQVNDVVADAGVGSASTASADTDTSKRQLFYFDNGTLMVTEALTKEQEGEDKQLSLLMRYGEEILTKEMQGTSVLRWTRNLKPTVVWALGELVQKGDLRQLYGKFDLAYGGKGIDFSEEQRCDSSSTDGPTHAEAVQSMGPPFEMETDKKGKSRQRQTWAQEIL
jgi:hypothetical protein